MTARFWFLCGIKEGEACGVQIEYTRVIVWSACCCASWPLGVSIINVARVAQRHGSARSKSGEVGHKHAAWKFMIDWCPPVDDDGVVKGTHTIKCFPH